MALGRHNSKPFSSLVPLLLCVGYIGMDRNRQLETIKSRCSGAGGSPSAAMERRKIVYSMYVKSVHACIASCGDAQGASGPPEGRTKTVARGAGNCHIVHSTYITQFCSANALSVVQVRVEWNRTVPYRAGCGCARIRSRPHRSSMLPPLPARQNKPLPLPGKCSRGVAGPIAAAVVAASPPPPPPHHHRP